MDRMDERRINLRLQPKEATFIALRPEFARLGKLRDINRQGLCFQYLCKGEPIEISVPLNVDMFVSNNGYYLPNIPCKLVYDKKVKNGAFVVGLEYRRCGLKFDRLNRQQSEQLELYLNEHTTKG